MSKVEPAPEDDLDYEQAKSAKEKGSEFFKFGETLSARQQYLTALMMLEQPSHTSSLYDIPKIAKMKLALLSNLSIVELKMHNYMRCIQYCSSYLSIVETHKKDFLKNDVITIEKIIKVLFRRFTAYHFVQEYEKAKTDITKCIQLHKREVINKRINNKNESSKDVKITVNKMDEKFFSNKKKRVVRVLKEQKYFESEFLQMKEIDNEKLFTFYCSYVCKSVPFKHKKNLQNNFDNGVLTKPNIYKEFCILYAWNCINQARKYHIEDRLLLETLREYTIAFYVFEKYKLIEGIVSVFNGVGSFMASCEMDEIALKYFFNALKIVNIFEEEMRENERKREEEKLNSNEKMDKEVKKNEDFLRKMKVSINEKTFNNVARNKAIIISNILHVEGRNNLNEKYCQDLITQVLSLNEEMINIKHKKINMASLYDKIAFVYSNFKEHEKAIMYYKKAFKVYKEFKYYNRNKMILTNLAISYRKLKKYKEALEYYNASCKIKKEHDDEETEMIILKNIALCYINLYDIDTGISYLKKALKVSNDIKKSHEFHHSFFLYRKERRNDFERANVLSILGNVYYTKSLKEKLKKDFNWNWMEKAHKSLIIGISIYLSLKEGFKSRQRLLSKFNNNVKLALKTLTMVAKKLKKKDTEVYVEKWMDEVNELEKEGK